MWHILNNIAILEKKKKKKEEAHRVKLGTH